MRKETISFVVLVRQSAWNMAAPPQRICVKLCVGIFTEISGENSSVIKIGKITEILCEYWMFMCVRNGWPWFVFITEILFTINCHRQSAVTTNQLSPPVNCHHQSAVTTNQLSPPISCHHKSVVTTNQLSPPISCYHQSAVTTNQLLPPISCHHKSAVTKNQLSLPIRCHNQSTVTTNHNDRWIGRGGPMARPPRSPDLRPMHFFLWGHIKALIYASPVDIVAIHVNICSKLVWNAVFSEYFSGFA